MKLIAITVALLGIAACAGSSARPEVSTSTTTTSASIANDTTRSDSHRAQSRAENTPGNVRGGRDFAAGDATGGGSAAIGRHPFGPEPTPRPVTTGDPPPR